MQGDTESDVILFKFCIAFAFLLLEDNLYINSNKINFFHNVCPCRKLSVRSLYKLDLHISQQNINPEKATRY